MRTNERRYEIMIHDCDDCNICAVWFGLQPAFPEGRHAPISKQFDNSRMIDSWDILDFLFFKHLKMSETIALKQF